MVNDVSLGTKHRNWKDGNNEDLCRFHRRHVARLGRRGARDDRRRACDERSLAGGGPARIRAERRTHGRMAFARRFRSSPPAGEHRVVFLHVARRIALEPGRRTRLRRHARTGRTGRPRLPARPAAAVLADSPSISRFRRPLPANPWRERIGPSPPSIRAQDGPGGSPPSGKPTGAPRRKPREFKRSPTRVARNILPGASRPRAPPDFGASRGLIGAFKNQHEATPARPSEVRGRRSRASGRKRPNRTSASHKDAEPKHADLIPEHVRANAPTTPAAEETRTAQKGDPNRRPGRLATKTPKTSVSQP